MSLEPGVNSRKLAQWAAELALEKNSLDTALLQVGKISIIADYFLIATGKTAVQVHSICDYIMENLKEAGYSLLRLEGYREGWWVVLDYGFLVIHIFQPDARAYYNLERLWGKAPEVALTE